MKNHTQSLLKRKLRKKVLSYKAKSLEIATEDSGDNKLGANKTHLEDA